MLFLNYPLMNFFYLNFLVLFNLVEGYLKFFLSIYFCLCFLIVNHLLSIISQCVLMPLKINVRTSNSPNYHHSRFIPNHPMYLLSMKIPTHFDFYWWIIFLTRYLPLIFIQKFFQIVHHILY
jgi:hypothetical protein